MPRIINEIIVHCSATEAGKNFHAADIRSWHKSKGWRDIGYHYVIDLDGTIEKGRRVSLAGAHCKGHNAHSIGICYIGGLQDGKPADTRTPAQKAAMNNLIGNLTKMYGCRTIGHRDIDPHKQCPCFDVKKEFDGVWKRLKGLI